MVRGGDKVPAGQFALWNYSITNPTPGVSLRAVDGAEALWLVVSPKGTVYAASYSEGGLASVKSTAGGSGVVTVSVPAADEDKLFIWDENLSPFLGRQPNEKY